jgi:hypothetical protein
MPPTAHRTPESPGIVPFGSRSFVTVEDEHSSMSTRNGDHYENAVAAVADRDYERAGNEYARAGWHVLANLRPGQEPFEADEKGWVGKGLRHFVTGAVCYRVADRPDRATNRGTEGSAVATDFRTALDHPVQRACLQELAADARVAGGLDGAADAYREAAEAYREAADSVDDPRYWSTTPLFQAVATPIQQTARSTANGEIAVTWEDLHGADPDAPGQFLATRARVKRQRFPSLVQAVVEDGHLAAPRGTTEYNNATYRCPNCGSSDVNWVAENTLCMRCSTPTEPR